MNNIYSQGKRGKRKPKKLPGTLTEEELITLVKGVKKKHHRLAYLLGFYQAMRISEIVKLRRENVDMKRNLIMIKDAKGGKDRNIPISPRIRTYLKYLPVGCGDRALQIAFKDHVKRHLARDDLHFHCLRHSGATYYLNVKRWNIRMLQQFLGHSNVSTTSIYTHISPEELMDAMLNEGG